MENASKALIMAAGVLIGVLILSLAVYLFVSFGSTVADINKQSAEQQLVEFNSNFTSYEGKEGLTIYDIITVAGYAKENNEYYENASDYKVEVKLGNISDIQNKIDTILSTYVQNDQASITASNPNLPTYSCKVTGYHSNGRVSIITFTKN